MVPGCMIQVRIDISANVTPLAFSNLNALRARAWPTKETTTVTKANSTSLASAEVKKAAVDGVMSPPLLRIFLPHFGPLSAMVQNNPDTIVENTARKMIVMGNQCPKRVC
jgi:hypothetical protein